MKRRIVHYSIENCNFVSQYDRNSIGITNVIPTYQWRDMNRRPDFMLTNRQYVCMYVIRVCCYVYNKKYMLVVYCNKPLLLLLIHRIIVVIK